jgi:hypothetical protein
MRRSSCLRFTAAAAVSLAAPAPSTALLAQDSPPAISGTWRLNENRSEKYDPQRERDLNRADATGATVRTGMGSRGRGGSSSGGAFGSGGQSDGRSMSPLASRVMQEATRQPQTLRIALTDSSVTIQGGPRPVTVLTNGVIVADSTLEGEIAYAVKATWKKEQLIVERQINNGATMLRSTYYLDRKDPKVLIVDVRFEDKSTRRTIDNRRVYNAESGPEPDRG